MTAPVRLTVAALLGWLLLAGCQVADESPTEPSATPMESAPTDSAPMDGAPMDSAPTNDDGAMPMEVTPAQQEFVRELLATPLPEAEATARIETAGYTWRLGTIDGEPQPVTMDYRLDRLTLTTEDGLVVDATWG